VQLMHIEFSAMNATTGAARRATLLGEDESESELQLTLRDSRPRFD
jgi:hypothetical protein